MLILLTILIVISTGCSLLKDTPFEGVGDKLTKPIQKLSESKQPEKQLNRFVQTLQTKDYAAATSILSEEAKKRWTTEDIQHLPYSTEGISVEKVQINNDSKTTAMIYYLFQGLRFQADLDKENGEW